MFSLVVYAQQQQHNNNKNKLSLADAIKMSLQKSEDLKIAQQNLRIAQLDNHKGNAGYLPSATLQMQQLNQYNRPNLQTYFVNQTYFQNIITPSVQAQWAVYNGGKNKIMEQQLLINQQIAQNNLSLQEQATSQIVTKQYYIALAEQEKVAILKKIYALSSRQYDLYQQRQQRGQVSRYETLLTEQSYRADDLSLRRQTIAYEKALAALCTAIGIVGDPNTYTLSDNLSHASPKQYYYEAPRTQNPLQKKWQLNNKLLTQNTLLAKSKQYPTLSLNAGSSLLFNNTKFKEATAISGSNFDVYVGAMLNMTIYNGGQIKRNIQKAKMEEEVAKLQTQQADRQLSAELKSKIAEHDDLVSLMSLSEQNNHILKSALQLADQRLQAGLSDIIEVRNLQMNDLQAQLKSIDLWLEIKLLEADIDYLQQK